VQKGISVFIPSPHQWAPNGGEGQGEGEVNAFTPPLITEFCPDYLEWKLQMVIGKRKPMAYFDRSEYLMVWLPIPLPEDILVATFAGLMITEKDREFESAEPGPSCGYIIRNWFGPFLLNPPSPHLHLRC
jgi:hypothetical protein